MGRQQAWRDATLTLILGAGFAFVQEYWTLTAALVVVSAISLVREGRASDRLDAFVSEMLEAKRRGVFLP